MKLREWARSNHVHPKTAYRWWRQGTLPLPARQVSARTTLVEQLQPAGGGVGRYARGVVARPARRPGPPDRPAHPVGSHRRRGGGPRGGRGGLGHERHRPRLRGLLADPSVTSVVEPRDRLARTNAELVEAALAAARRLVVVEAGEVDDDLARDTVEVLTSFCARRYGRRSARNRALKALRCAERDVGPPGVEAGTAIAGQGAGEVVG